MFFINKMILVLVIQYELNFWYVNNFMLYVWNILIKMMQIQISSFIVLHQL